PYVGVFRSLDEGAAAQLPLHTAVVTLAGPIDGATRTVVAVDTSFPAARRHATVAACETYATALLGATRLGRGSWWGWNATTAQAAPLPPVSAAGAPSVAAGLTWSEAVVRGVLRQLHALPEESGAELSDAEHSTETARLLSIARVLTPTLTWSVTNALPRVFPVAVHAGAVHAGSCALDVDTALRGALSEVVARCQGVTPSEGSLTVPPVCGPADADLVASDLIGHVRDAGWDVWVAPVDEDAAVAAAMPYLAAVALIPAG